MKINDVLTDTPQYSTFDLSSMHRTSLDMGYLVPIHVLQTLPGDKLSIDVDAFVRGMPTIAPIVDKVDIKINHFYVPYRILWDGFEDFITMSDTYKALSQNKPEIPYFTSKAVGSGTDVDYPNGRLLDYLGIPNEVVIANEMVASLNGLPVLAYNKIFLEYYTPQRWVNFLTENNIAHDLVFLKRNLELFKNGMQTSIGAYDYFYANDSEDQNQLLKLRKVGWNHDYFTNALPLPTMFGDVVTPLFNEASTEKYFDIEGGKLPFDENGSVTASGNANRLSTIRDLRKAISLQHYLEKLSLTGGRYLEHHKVIWGQNLKNQQLQRPEYLGGDVIPLFVNEVESTAETEGASLGDVGGKPVSAGKFENIFFEADEFGVYMCLAHIVPKRSYANTLNKMWTLKDPLDFPNPDFEDIGDQAVYQYELLGSGKDVFGYVPRYSEYKGAYDRFSGEMIRTLKHWHFGLDAENLKNFTEISPEFIETNIREDIFKVPDEPDKFLGTFQFNIKATRKLQANAVAGINRI